MVTALHGPLSWSSSSNMRGDLRAGSKKLWLGKERCESLKFQARGAQTTKYVTDEGLGTNEENPDVLYWGKRKVLGRQNSVYRRLFEGHGEKELNRNNDFFYCR